MKKILIVTIITAVVMTLSGCDAINAVKDRFFSAEAEPEITEQGEEAEEFSNCITFGVVDFDTFNPLTTQSQTVREAMEIVYEPLFELDAEMRIVPVLAESYSVSPDGRVISINLRQGIKWQDGSDFTAYDAAYTIKSIRGGQTTYTDVLENVADHRITDDYSIEITLRSSVPNFAALLTFPIVKYQTPMTISPVYTPVGTGAFKFDGKLGTDKMQFSAFDGYHGGRALTDNAFIVFAPDADRYISMFEASETDIITSNMVDLMKYMPKGGIKINKFITNKFTFLGFNTSIPELSGSETRVGLSEAINKDDIIRSVLYSHAVAVDAPINPSSYLYSTDKTIFEADDISARDRLANEGWKLSSSGTYTREVNSKRQSLSLKILTNAESEEKLGVANKISEYFQKIGVDAKVDAVSYDEYVKRINEKNFDIFIGETEMKSNLDLSPLVSSAGNYFSYQSSDVDTLIAQLGMTQGEEEQKLLFAQLAEIMARDMPFVPLYYREGSALSGAKIKFGINPSVSSFYRGCGQWSTKQ